MTSTSPDSAANVVDGRRRNRIMRRERLYQAGIQLFVERGFQSTTMDDIAERARVSRATVFNHFDRKTAFIDESGRPAYIGHLHLSDDGCHSALGYS